MSPSTISKSQTLPCQLLQSKPFSLRGTFVNQPRSCRLSSRLSELESVQIRLQISGVTRHRSFSPRDNYRSLTAQIRSMGLESMAFGRRGGGVLTTLVAIGCSLYSSPAEGASKEEEFVRKTISSHDIVIFSKSYCPYCATAKAVFKKLNKVPHVIELDEIEDGSKIQDALIDLVGRHTVPQVFIKGKHIGGCDDTVEAYESGALAKFLDIDSK